MSTYLAHAANESEYFKFKRIDGNPHFSIAEYDSASAPSPLRRFVHKHEEYEFVIPLETVPLLHYRDSKYLGEVGFVYPVNPNVLHGAEFDLTSSRVIDITVSSSHFDIVKKSLGYSRIHFSSRFACRKKLMELIRSYQEEVELSERNERRLQRLMDSIIAILIKDGVSVHKSEVEPSKSCGKDLRLTLAYMNNHFRDPNLTIAVVAEKNGFSPTYFSKTFKAYMHNTPISHLNRLRTSAARTLLNDKTLSLSAIAKMVGYKNVSTFSEAFKNLLHMTPKEYRKTYC